MPDPASKAVFLSYASQDAEAAKHICEALRAAGVEVWFDQDALVGGDAWDAKIRGQIGSCALFIPVISAATQERLEGYFRLEWKLAANRSHTMAEEKTFLLPVVIDATRDAEGKVPTEFRAVQWTKLPGGENSTGFVADVKRLLDGPRKPGTGRLRESPAGATAQTSSQSPAQPPTGKAGLPGWTWAAGVIVLVLVGYFAFRPTAKETPTSQPAPAVVTTKSVPVPPAASAASKNSLAVLPFENLSSDKDNEFFSSGIREEILADLQTVQALHVIQYRGSPKSVRQIGQELNVAYALECSVRREGTKVRVTAHLTNTRTEEQVWVHNFERDLSDVFIIQSELAQAIAGELSVVISPVEKSAIERRPTTSVAAYDLYLKARDIRMRAVNTQSATDRTESLLRSAVELDPQFALAWGELAYTHAFRYSSGQDRTAARVEEARAALAMLEKLAPDDPETIRQQGNFLYFVPRDYARASQLFLRLIVIRPNDPESYYSLCQVQRRMGKWAESLENFKRAIALDPQNDRLLRNAAVVLSIGRHYDEELALQQRRAELMPGNEDAKELIGENRFRATGSTAEGDVEVKGTSANTRIYWAIERGDAAEVVSVNAELSEARQDFFDSDVAVSLVALGQAADPRERLNRSAERLKAAIVTQPTNAGIWMSLAEIQLALGEREAALTSGRKAVELLPETTDAWDGPRLVGRMAMVYAWTGDTERALADYARLLGNGGANVHELRHAPLPPALKNDPRFEALVNDPKNNAPLF